MADPNQQILEDLIRQHGSLVGRGAPDTDPKNYPDLQSDGTIADPYYTYSFNDGASVEMNSTGQVRKSTQGTRPAANTPAEPNVSTTAKSIPVWNAQTKVYDWITNPNYVDPASTSRTPAPGTSAPPGDFVWNPSGGSDGKGGWAQLGDKAPSKSADDIHAESVANVGQSNATSAHEIALAGAVETPAQVYARLVGVANATAHAQGKAEIEKAQALVNSGITMTEQDKINLNAKLQSIQSQQDAAIAQAQTQYTHELNQPNVDTTNRIAQQNADTSVQQVENNRIAQEQSADQADRNQKSDILKQQATAGSDFINQGIKLGVTSSMGSVHMALDPLVQALSMSRQAVQAGQVPASAYPRVSAPQPVAAAAPPQAPLPAPGVQPPAPQPAPDSTIGNFALPAGVA